MSELTFQVGQYTVVLSLRNPFPGGQQVNMSFLWCKYWREGQELEPGEGQWFHCPIVSVHKARAFLTQATDLPEDWKEYSSEWLHGCSN